MSERSAVQEPMLRYAAEIGWQRVPQVDALRLRGGEAGLFFTSVLRDQLLALNPGVVDAARAEDILRRLRLLKPTIEGNRDALAWLRGEQSVFVPSERRERNVCLIDFDHPERNVYQVTDEWSYRGVVYRNRADVVFLINGIPVATVETKGATKADGLAEGVVQIRRYHRETPELFLTSQVFEVTQLLDFYYGATWSASRKNLFNWKDVVQQGSYEQKVKAFFDHDTFLRLVRDYIVFLTRDDVLSKVILRQHQMRAVEKVLARVQEGTKRRGLIWHTQGSGKTLTMLTIAAKLLAMPGGEKPTILMLVDRNELESQLFRNVMAYGIGTVKVAQSKRDLHDLLRSDYRGLIVAMVHKFDDMPAALTQRSNIIVLVDEAHRTTGGDLGNFLMGALPNASYIGFTGTPIDTLAKGTGTFKVFGKEDPQGYLDKYSIAESIGDGTTVRLHYALAPSTLRVDRGTLEREFLHLAQAEGLSDLDELNSLLDRAVVLTELMKAPERVSKVAATVADHFRDHIDPLGFKALLVAVDREACALYKRELDKHLPPAWSTVVYSPAHNDEALLKQYYLTEDQEKDVRKRFIRKDALPKILIVTDKLLTGFDAPILYCMYLDKPMRDHVLLQAIARVNRPYEEGQGQSKPFGLVYDFVGIFEKLEAALAFDSDVVTSVIQNIDALKQLFATWMRGEAQQYLPYARGWDDKAKERAVMAFAEPSKREAFFKFMRNLQSLYEILSPDAFLRPFLEGYLALQELYSLIRAAQPHPYVDPELTAKTKALLRQHSQTPNLEPPGMIRELGPQELAALKASSLNDVVKVLNLQKILTAKVAQDGPAQPFLLTIGDRAEALAQAYEDRQMTTQQALAELEKLAQESIEAEAERTRLGLEANSFAIYTALAPFKGDLTAVQATELNAAFLQYPDHLWSEEQAKRLRSDLYKLLRPLVGAKFIDATNALLRLQRV